MAFIADSLHGLIEWLPNAPVYLASLSVLIFVHEYGHFWVARRCGVRIEMFSIGFGRELFGWTDRHGARWRIAVLPIGGFVKMFGDADAASRPDAEGSAAMNAADRSVAFTHKPLYQKALIVAAGPFANFFFAIFVMAILFSTVGQPFTPPVVGEVMPGSAAERAGLQKDDVIESIDGVGVQRFEELRQIVLLNPGQPLDLSVTRDGQTKHLVATPDEVDDKDILGKVSRIGQLGMRPASALLMRQEDPATALWQAGRETWSIATGSLESIGQIITGRRSADDLHGPVGIAQIVAKVSHEGFLPLVQLVAFLSISLGLVNLFPIPVLDGGHLLFYAIEAVRRRPASDQMLAVSFRVGLVLIVSFFLFVTFHDSFR